MVRPIRHRKDAPAGPGDAPAPVFVDGSGRRWLRIRLAVLPVLVLLSVAGAVVGRQVYAMPRQVPGGASADLDAIAAEVTAQPVIVGSGPLVRTVRVDGSGTTVRVFDAATGAPLGELTGDDAAHARGHRYVVQRFGYSPGARRTISLTFDDGPDARYTPRLLDLLSREHAPATFFNLGQAMVENPDITRREAREGHLVADHSMTHPNLSTVPAWRTRLELVGTDRTVRSLTGRQTPLVRLPYEGDDEKETIAAVVGGLRAQSLGYVFASHDVDSLDWYYTAAAPRTCRCPSSPVRTSPSCCTTAAATVTSPSRTPRG